MLIKEESKIKKHALFAFFLARAIPAEAGDTKTATAGARAISVQKVRMCIAAAIAAVALIACAVIQGAVNAQAEEAPTTKVDYLTYTLDTTSKTASVTSCDESVDYSGSTFLDSDLAFYRETL